MQHLQFWSRYSVRTLNLALARFCELADKLFVADIFTISQ